MFYVGTYSTFCGKDSVHLTKVKEVEKLGHSAGRAKRYLNAHKPLTVNHNPAGLGCGDIYRGVVFVLSDRFRLNNEVIQMAMRELKCDWQTAKFHCYRVGATDVIGNKEDWADLFPTQQSTAEPPEPVNPANAPETTGAAPLPV